MRIHRDYHKLNGTTVFLQEYYDGRNIQCVICFNKDGSTRWINVWDVDQWMLLLLRSPIVILQWYQDNGRENL